MYLFQGLTVKTLLLFGNLDPVTERDLVLVRWPMLYRLFSVLLLLLYTLRVVDREGDNSSLLGTILSIYQSSTNPRYTELGSYDLSTTHNLGYQILQGEIVPI
jgi:hypothetical protein